MNDWGDDEADGGAVAVAAEPIGRVTSYGYQGDPNGDSASLGRGRYRQPTGAWDNALRETSFAASPDIEQHLTAQGVKPMEPVRVHFDDGTDAVRTWDDRTAQDRQVQQPLRGRIDFYSPSGPSPLNDKRVVGLEPVRAEPQVGLWNPEPGAAANDWGDVPVARATAVSSPAAAAPAAKAINPAEWGDEPVTSAPSAAPAAEDPAAKAWRTGAVVHPMTDAQKLEAPGLNGSAPQQRSPFEAVSAGAPAVEGAIYPSHDPAVPPGITIPQGGVTWRPGDAAAANYYGHILIDPKRYQEGVKYALEQGWTTPDHAATMLADEPKVVELAKERERLVAAAGENPEMKALLAGVTRGTVMAGAAYLGGRGGAMAGGLATENPLGAGIGATVAGATAAVGSSLAYDTALKELAKSNELAATLDASSKLQPSYAQTGELAAFLVPGPGSIAKLARGAGIAAGSEGGAAAAKFIGKQVGASAAIGAGTDLAVRGAGQALGLPGMDFDTSGTLSMAGLAALMAGHGLAFKDYSTPHVADILRRGVAWEQARQATGDNQPMPAGVAPLAAHEQAVFDQVMPQIQALRAQPMAPGESLAGREAQVTAQQVAGVGGTKTYAETGVPVDRVQMGAGGAPSAAQAGSAGVAATAPSWSEVLEGAAAGDFQNAHIHVTLSDGGTHIVTGVNGDDITLAGGRVVKSGDVTGAIDLQGLAIPRAARTSAAGPSAPAVSPTQAMASQLATERAVTRGAGTVVLGANGTEFPANYAWAPRALLQASHTGETLSPNPEYPLTNTRDYSDPAEKDKVLATRNEWDPRRAITDSPDASVGPPMVARVIGTDGVAQLAVVGGNNRQWAMQNLSPAQWQATQAVSNAKAPQMGLSTTTDPDAQIVRHLGTFDFRKPGEEARLQGMVDALNPSPGMVQGTAKRASIDATAVPAETLSGLTMDMAPAEAQAAVRGMIASGAVDRNRTAPIAASGAQSQDYVQRLLVNAAFRVPQIAEARGDNRPGNATMRGLIDAATPALVRLRGKGPEGSAVADSVARAFATVLDATRSQGADGLPHALATVAAQGELDPVHAPAQAIAQQLAAGIVRDKAGRVQTEPTLAHARRLFEGIDQAVQQHSEEPNLWGDTRSVAGTVVAGAAGAPSEQRGGVRVGNATIVPPEAAGEMRLEEETAYHGTPHKVDKFSLEKVGTGEGAQVYGWGLYFAENPSVAEQYFKKFGGEQKRPTGKGITDHEAEWAALGQELTKASERVMNAIHGRGDLKAAEAQRAAIEAKMDALHKRMLETESEPIANLYTVSLDVDPHELLDWDKPMMEQSEAVQKALQKAGLMRLGNALDTGNQAYHEAVRRNGSAQAASKLLLDAGIPGIRYADAWSRARQPGDQSYNYVIFDESKIRITHENGREVSASQAVREESYLNAKGVTDPARRAAALAGFDHLAELQRNEQLALPYGGGDAAGAVAGGRRDTGRAPLDPAERANLLAGLAWGRVTPAQIQAAFIEGRTISTIFPELIDPQFGANFKGALVRSPLDLAMLAVAGRTPYVERLGVAALNEQGRVTHSQILHVGTINSVNVDATAIVRAVQLHGAGAKDVVIWHNHPSGDPTPSKPDAEVTAVVGPVLARAGLRLLDHLITDGDRFWSLREGKATAFPAPQMAAWEIVPRAALPMTTVQTIASTVRTSDPDAIHAVHLTTQGAMTALERLPANLSVEQLAGALIRSGSREGARSVSLVMPRELGSAEEASRFVQALRAALPTGIGVLDVSTPRVPSFYAAGLMDARAPEVAVQAAALQELREEGPEDLERRGAPVNPLALELDGAGNISVPQVLVAFKGIADALGGKVPIRFGRFLQRAYGVYKNNAKVVRLGNAGDLATAAHEIAHALADLSFGSTSSADLMRQTPIAMHPELYRLGVALYGRRMPGCGYEAEGFAEFVRHYLTEDNARTVAPETYRWFTETMLRGNPALSAAVGQAKAAADLWRSEGAFNRAVAQMPPAPGRLAQLRAQAKATFSAENWIEEFKPLQDLAKEYELATGRTLTPSTNPYEVASAKRGASGSVTLQMVLHGMIDVNGNLVKDAAGNYVGSLRDVLAPVRGLKQEFENYLWARRAVERYSRGMDPGMAELDALHLVNTLGTKYPAFDRAAEELYRWQNSVLDYLVQANPAMQETVDKIRANNSDYVPLKRYVEASPLSTAAGAAGGSPLARFKGSGRQVKPIISEVIGNTQKIVAMAHRAMVLNTIVKLADAPGLGHIIEEVPRAQVKMSVSLDQLKRQMEDLGIDMDAVGPGEVLDYYAMADRPKGTDPVVPIKTATGVKWFHVQPELYDLLQGLEPTRLPWLADVFLGVPARVFRAGTTGWRASFGLVTNPDRDIQTFAMQTMSTANPPRVLAAYLGALREVVASGLGGKPSEFVSMFERLAIEAGQPLGIDVQHTAKATRALFRSPLRQLAANPLEMLRSLLNFMEKVPRIAELKLISKQIGWAPGTPLTPDQAITLALAGRRVTTDFAAGGHIARVFNQAVPFFNANIQGGRSAARAAKAKPWATLIKAIALIAVPALVAWFKNKDEDWYQNLPWNERYLYWNVKWGDNVIQIPKAQEWGHVATLTEGLADTWSKGDPRGAREALSHMADVQNPADYPVLLRTAKEQWQNRVAFFDRPIVPRAQEDLLPGEQVGPYTSVLAAALGRAFPERVSPRRLDAAVRAIGGGLGGDALSATDSLMGLLGIERAAKGVEREGEAADVFVLGRLFRHGGVYSSQSQVLADFWDAYNLAGMRHRGQGDLKDEGAFATLSRARASIKQLDDMATQAARMEDRQKLYKQMTERAKDALAELPPSAR